MNVIEIPICIFFGREAILLLVKYLLIYRPSYLISINLITFWCNLFLIYNLVAHLAYYLYLHQIIGFTRDSYVIRCGNKRWQKCMDRSCQTLCCVMLGNGSDLTPTWCKHDDLIMIYIFCETKCSYAFRLHYNLK